ncbi:hypothetical protein R3W88_031755 [Solanum pinnatisectum]|uniref:Isopenicillin N synthase-like Fe(2+) 2OG dioxygenase domain-containing protein n=1 Tax=Solanum pinnatisectum TaxID=50273 RepID=A0AAV9LN96_9SOLN|nr:hypothetical protein R3W88_031755 [Solanum pinnatisectum]
MKNSFDNFSETRQLLEGFLNDSLGLPPNFLKDYNDDKSTNILLSYQYFPAIKSEDNSATFHQDPTVLTNDKFVSPFHQVVKPKGKSRYVFVIFYNLSGEKWVQPLPQFIKDIGKLQKYRRF